jgi:hypothetical protein
MFTSVKGKEVSAGNTDKKTPCEGGRWCTSLPNELFQRAAEKQLLPELIDTLSTTTLFTTTATTAAAVLENLVGLLLAATVSTGHSQKSS